MNELPQWFEITSLVVIGGVLLADLLIIGRRPHVPSFSESAKWVGAYVVAALVFAGLVLLVGGPQPAQEFVAGWLTEYSLSLDNLFVFTLIMASFAVPRILQQRTLMIGIIIALVLRAGLILVGASIIERFSWVFYIFGVILLVTAVKMIGGNEEEDYKENLFIRTVRRIVPVSPDFEGTRLRVQRDGTWMVTPMLLVILALGTTDLLFAFDSIPAIFGLTSDPFIVFTTNLFALMGLRQLYFMLGGLMERLVYLNYGLAAVLAFIGIKLVLEALHQNSLPFLNSGQPFEWAPEIPIWASLLMIVASLGIAAVASLLWPPRAITEAVVESEESGP